MSVMTHDVKFTAKADSAFAYRAVFEVTVPTQYYFDTLTLWRIEDYLRFKARVNAEHPIEWWAEYPKSIRRCDPGTRKHLGGVSRFFARLTVEHA